MGLVEMQRHEGTIRNEHVHYVVENKEVLDLATVEVFVDRPKGPANDFNKMIHKKSRRHIRFATMEAEVVGYVPMRSDLTADEVRDTWLSTSEYQGIRLGAKFLTKDVRARDKELVSGIDEAYARALHLACSLSDEDYDDVIQDCSSQTTCLKPWCERNISARGLERYTSKKHRYERSEYAVETREAVLRLAQSSEVTEEELSLFYREYARSAALYARFCGQADNAVVAGDPTLNREDLSVTFKTDDGCLTNSNSTLPTVSSSASTLSPCDRKDLMRRSKEPSRGRLLVRELSQRRMETVALT